jgi:hypothetical protein
LSRSGGLRFRGDDRNRGGSEKKSEESNGIPAVEALHDLRGYQKLQRA